MFFSDFARRPISDNSPSGNNPNNLDDFDEIKRQINNLSKVTGQVSWKKVQSLSKNILISDSKDFRCSCYYTVAATHNEGLKGLVEGLNSLLDLCVVYWYSAYPDLSKPTARIGAIDWLIEHAEKRLKHIKVSKEELPLIEAGHRICLNLEEELRLHFGIKAPSFGGIRRMFMQWIESFKEQAAEAERKAQKAAIKVEVMKPATPAPTAPPAPVKPEANNRSALFTISAMVIAVFAITSSYFVFKNYQLSSLKQQVEMGSVSQLKSLTAKLPIEYRDAKDALKMPLLTRLDALMNNWPLEPSMVSQMDDLGEVVRQVTALYPDSSSAKQLNQNYLDQRSAIEQEYQAIHRRFTNARTVFANVIAASQDQQAKQAYEYSNTLFPLLGRIEYAEKARTEQELDKSLKLLNVYLYKINQIRNSLSNTNQ
ncbi:type VI secretion system protein VasL [Vibrio xiamenensis]|uniref:Type VI secretion system protein VasL n=1 Tax=Vibrio xiamenensis TaxID=861298 RepID=A0A1G8DT38_9VIBR|nr:type VI secretion system ImpA family N-terminal domain-containing protein [Vibrio xiamenensis]SDH60876.1 type VI secretion system protein VasL [Vibrio xiamenensis]